jgi:hypothetical protein
LNLSETQEEVDWNKVTEMQDALNEYTEEKLKRAMVFDPKDIVRKAKQINEVYIEDLGTVRYVYLSYADLNAIGEKPMSDRERSVQILLKQLAPANPGLTADDICAMPYEVVVKLLVKLQGEGSFFPKKPAQAPKTSPTGSESALKPKTSV